MALKRCFRFWFEHFCKNVSLSSGFTRGSCAETEDTTRRSSSWMDSKCFGRNRSVLFEEDIAMQQQYVIEKP